MEENSKNSVEFITDTAGRKSGYTTPQNYFDGIEDTLFTKLATENIPKTKSFEIRW